MCKGGSKLGNLAFDVVNTTFTIMDSDIDDYFDGLGGTNNQ